MLAYLKHLAYDQACSLTLMKATRFSALMASTLVCALTLTCTRVSSAESPAVTAVDILLVPDATMIKHAEDVNARLRAVYPEGFALDDAHRPHITLYQSFVPIENLDKVFAAAGKVLAGTDVAGLKLKAFKYYYVRSGKIGLAGMVAKPPPELVKLQAGLIAAVAPLTVKSGTVSAFFTTPEQPHIDPVLIPYVEKFATTQTGEHFSPHVSIGIASKEYLDKMLAEPFDAFTFSMSGAAVYQLGDFGTAAKLLKTLDLKP
jgi:2'-5' RNA ligase superfamily